MAYDAHSSETHHQIQVGALEAKAKTRWFKCFDLTRSPKPKTNHF